MVKIESESSMKIDTTRLDALAFALDLHAALVRCRNTAMEQAIEARVPECGYFAEMAQDLDWICNQLYGTNK
jgi:hypothetical protein